MSAALALPPQEVVPNPHRVPVKAWRKWSFNQRTRFNAIYERFLSAPDVICPPEEKVSATAWAVIAWNCAWLATDELEK